MKDLLNYIQVGAETTDSVTLYIDRNLLRQFKQLETRISREIDSDLVSALEEEKAEVRKQLQESAITIDFTLINNDTRFDLRDALLEERPEVSDTSDEFQTELALRWIGASISRITSPVEVTEGALTRDEMAALKESLLTVPANWYTVMETFNQMLHSELLADLEMSSPDF